MVGKTYQGSFDIKRRKQRKLIQEFDHEVGVEASTYTTVSERQRQVIRIGSAVAEDVYSSYIF